MRLRLRPGLWAPATVLALLVQGAGPLPAQTFTSSDAVLQRIWEEGTGRSQLERLAQVLLDSLGPRLTGTPESEAASNWVARTYRSWGIEARQERYGSWTGWRRGQTSLALTQPRVRSIEGTLLAWSPGTGGAVTTPAITLPLLESPSELPSFLESARGKVILLSPAQPSCRPDESWQEWGSEATVAKSRAARTEAYRSFNARLQSIGIMPEVLLQRLVDAGIAGILTSTWPDGWGVQNVHDALSDRVPSFDVACEDYGLIFRLAENGQGPVLRIEAHAEMLGDVPVWNTVGVIPGRELPDEYVVLSAHFDSWDSSSGATDNGAGTVTMMEALRILKATYPNPRRTILVGHWNGEEQGLIGSRAFAAAHPEIVAGLQALFNQDEGTGRVTRISMQGLAQAGSYFKRWLSKVPTELAQIELVDPGAPSGGGSDEASFVCARAPAFRMSGRSWDYGPYTWHTNRDSYDKLVFDDLRGNAVLTAMLAYLAAEEPERFPRDPAPLPIDPRTGQATQWPVCRAP